MNRNMFSKKINLTPGVTVASLHRGVTPMHSISSFLQFYRIGNIERRRCSSSVIIIASRSSKHMHIISIKIIMCNGKRQPINIILTKRKLLRYSVVGRIQKDNRTSCAGAIATTSCLPYRTIASAPP